MFKFYGFTVDTAKSRVKCDVMMSYIHILIFQRNANNSNWIVVSCLRDTIKLRICLISQRNIERRSM